MTAPLRRCSALPLVLLAGFVLLGSSPAWGQGVEDLIRQANDLRRAGDDDGARSLLLQAYQTARTPVTAGQLGLCEYALSRWVDAESRLIEALRTPQDPWVARNRATLVEVLDKTRTHLARVDITGSPPGAEVQVAGKPVGSLPLAGPVRVVVGPVHVRLSAPGHRPRQQEVTVAAGERRAIVVHLEPESPGTPSHAVGNIDAVPRLHAGADSADRGTGSRLGAFLRMDLAVYPALGQRLLPGFSYGVSDQLDVGIAAVLGRQTRGLWAGSRFAFLTRPVRPAVTFGIPVIWLTDGPRLGVQAGVGAGVPIGDHLELFADLTTAAFPGLDETRGGFWILPSLGIQARY
jgi:hypothetical protein